MISSTFDDFKQHRAALIGAISGLGSHPVAMEQDSALPAGTMIDSSLQKVRDAAAYACIIGARYGSVPDSPECNPDGLSLAEMEFREARDLGRPMLVFIVGSDHEVKQRDVELDPGKRRKLEAFREEAQEFGVIAIEPELEAWIMNENAHLARIFKCPENYRQILHQAGWWPTDLPKPPRPKEALKHLMQQQRVRVGNADFGKLAAVSRQSSRGVAAGGAGRWSRSGFRTCGRRPGGGRDGRRGRRGSQVGQRAVRPWRGSQPGSRFYLATHRRSRLMACRRGEAQPAWVKVTM